MKVSFLLNNPQEPPLTISNIPLQEVQVAKILGVNISDDLRWSVHVAEILKKANGRNSSSALTCLMMILSQSSRVL